MDRGGAETQLLTLARLQSKQNTITIFSLRHGNLKSDFLKVGIEVLTPRRRNLLLSALTLMKLVRSGSFDLMHAHLPRAELVSRFALWGKKLPLFITRHNYESFIPYIPKEIIFLSSLLSRWVTRRAYAVISISHSVREFITINKEVSKHCKLLTIYYGFDDKFRTPFQYKIPSDKIIVGTVSRLVNQKRIDILLHAFSLARHFEPRLDLHIIGSGENESKLKELAGTLNIKNCVTWIPNTDERLKLMAGFDILVLASDYEGFGLVLLEAIQCRVPIIASANTAIVEVLGPEYIGLFSTGSISELQDKILLFSKMDSIQKHNIQRYLDNRVKLFTPVKMYEEIEGLYKEGTKTLKFYDSKN